MEPNGDERQHVQINNQLDTYFILWKHYVIKFITDLGQVGFFYGYSGVRRGRDGMVVRFTTTCAISAYHH